MINHGRGGKKRTRNEERRTKNEERGTRNEERGKRKEERGKRKEERGKRKEERKSQSRRPAVFAFSFLVLRSSFFVPYSKASSTRLPALATAASACP
jgi:hypothetical protein